MKIDRYASVPSDPTLQGLRRVYAAAFAEAPYGEGPAEADEFVKRVTRYSSHREGFRLWVAQTNGQVAGLALAVTGRPGDWWRDRVAEHLGQQLAGRWLGDRVVEVVHVAVDPQQRRRGIGAALMAEIATEDSAPTAVLGCHRKASPAQQLYLRAGWNLISSDFELADGESSLLMAREQTLGSSRVERADN